MITNQPLYQLSYIGILTRGRSICSVSAYQYSMFLEKSQSFFHSGSDKNEIFGVAFREKTVIMISSMMKGENAVNNEDIWRIALAQSACDCNCRPEDFFADTPLVTLSRAHPNVRRYLPLPFALDMVSYGNCVVAQTAPELAESTRAFLQAYPAEHCFETPHLHVLEEILRPYGLSVCYMAEYFLPDATLLKPLPCKYPLRLLHPDDFAALYTGAWSNALCEKRRELDALAVGAYDGNMLIGLAGCSADCESMYQIGVDVLPAYRRQGIAAALTSRLALEILKLDKVPFYCAAWCNLKSVRNAVKCGFRPAWVELTARSKAHVAQLNERGVT